MPYETWRATLLGTGLPIGTDVYIALYDGDPIAGGSELTLTDYARVAFSDWVTNDSGTDADRVNNSDIVWPVINQAGTATHWAIFNDPGLSDPSANLLRSGECRDALGIPVTINIGVGDEPRMLSGTLMVGLREF